MKLTNIDSVKNKNSEKVAKILLSIKAISLSPKKPYRYSSGILSPVYTDCRLLMSYPKERATIISLYAKAIKSTGKFDVIAGTATAGIPHAAWIADKLKLPMIYVRGKVKDHGKGNQIEGKLIKKQKAAVIEDLISTGESSTETVRAIRKKGGNAYHIFSIITYGMKKSRENFNKWKIKLISLTDFPTVVKVAEQIGYIKSKDKDLILQWTNDPVSWGRKMGFEK